MDYITSIYHEAKKNAQFTLANVLFAKLANTLKN